MAPKGAILHVGSNRHFRFLGPVHGDGTFKFIPIPEDKHDPERSWKYEELGLAEDLPRNWKWGKYAHYDPEFLTFTYGDPIEHTLRLRHARELREDEFLFFLASLRYSPRDGETRASDIDPEWAYYLIGFFELAEPPIVLPYPFPDDARKRFSNNANVRRVNDQRPIFIFEGTKNGKEHSRQLMRAVALSNEVVPNTLARQAMPWLTPRPNKGWAYRWWGENFVFPEGVQILLRAMGLDL